MSFHVFSETKPQHENIGANIVPRRWLPCWRNYSDAMLRWPRKCGFGRSSWQKTAANNEACSVKCSKQSNRGLFSREFMLNSCSVHCFIYLLVWLAGLIRSGLFRQVGKNNAFPCEKWRHSRIKGLTCRTMLRCKEAAPASAPILQREIVWVFCLDVGCLYSCTYWQNHL